MTFRVYFDGKVLVPEHPIDLPVGQRLEVSVTPVEPSLLEKTPLARLAERAGKFPENPELPSDGAAQHDHYLYGSAKQP